jgi:cell division protein FtsW
MIATLRARLEGLRAGYLQRPYTSIQLLLLAGGMLLTFGILMATSTTISASLHDGNQGSLWAQLLNEGMFLIIGIPVLWLGLRISPRGYRLLAYPMLIVAMLLLLAVLVPHVGVEINNAKRWFRLGPVQVQPSEFAKLAMLVWGADLLARKDELRTLTRARHVLLPLVPAFVFVCALVMLEPDLGTTLCFLAIMMGLLWTVGLPIRYFAAMFGFIAGAVTLLAILEPYRLQRLTSFMDPFADKSDSGHQAVQGFYALASGGIFGVGLGSGTSKFGWVPNANTDYVFAVVGEELGLLGCLAVLASFGLFAYAALRIAHRTDDTFVRLAASGTAVWLCGQALINIGYVAGLLPVTGIPLPFVSAGGTSLVLTMGVLGMLLSFGRHEPAAIAAAKATAVNGRPSGLAGTLRLGLPKATVQRQRPARGKASTPRVKAATPRVKASTPRVKPPAPRIAPAARERHVQTARPAPVRRPAPAPEQLRPTGTDTGRAGSSR